MKNKQSEVILFYKNRIPINTFFEPKNCNNFLIYYSYYIAQKSSKIVKTIRNM